MKKAVIKLLTLSVFMFWLSSAYGYEPTYNAFQVKVSGKGKPVILVPGATCSGDEWKETVAHLEENYECHVLTLAGYAGVPALPNGPYLEKYKDQLEQYIVNKHLEHVTLIGHSIGGVVCLWLASEMNVRLDRILIIDALPFFAAAQNPDAKGQYVEAQSQAMWATYKSTSDEQFKKGQLSMAKFLCKDSTKWDMLVSWGMVSDRKTMAYTMTEMMAKDLRTNISTIKVPTLILAAYNKNPEAPAFTHDAVTQVFSTQYAACKKCTVHVAEDNTKHFIMYDNPAWYFKEMDAFLGR